MKANNWPTHSKQKFPVVESDGTFWMKWLVSFFDVPPDKAKAKLDELVKIHQKENKLIFRYDNHPIPLKNIPEHHMHHLTEENIIKSDSIPDLSAVLQEILIFLPM